ncbi:hypothetical protein BU15DRAFT_86923 [Melanogaster broomeanus]|nr:hypothetical protein BU15DRAFT_86923 [Melanogaster broomeanus]
MDYPSLNSLWDLAQAPSQFSQLPDDDFLALLQKQFPASSAQKQQQPLPNLTPPSDDSSPSPPNASPIYSRANDNEDSALKRKASDHDMDPGPSSKNQHTDTAEESSTAKKGQPSRRKSTGNPQRKEQNRAAQRAFRERKEKHVKGDKVAALEAKNEASATENTNLRDLLSRLQQENLALKQAQFTFSIPKPAQASTSAATSAAQPAPFSFFTTPVPMQTDYTNSPFGQYALPQSYKTIATNPLLMSFADDTPSSATTDTLEQFNFNFPSQSNSWNSTSQSSPFTQNYGQNDLLPTNHSLDELFGGNYMANQSSLDFSALVDSTSMSPVVHGNGGKSVSPQDSVSSNSTNSISSPSSASTSNGQSPFSWSTISRPDESPPSASESPSSATPHGFPKPLTREDVADHIARLGQSPFTNPSNSTARISPKTNESPDNVEVLKAWRSITQHPHFKVCLSCASCCRVSGSSNGWIKQDADVNELCTEFAKKARCDGTKVVLEPEGVHYLIESFKSKYMPHQQQPQPPVQQQRPGQETP